MMRFNKFTLLGMLFLIAFTLIRFVWEVEPAYQPQTIHTQPETQPTDAYTQSISQPEGWVSPAGLRYGEDPSPKFPHRIAHVMAHTKPDASKRKHSQFILNDQVAVLKLLDTAWSQRGPPKRQGGARGRDVYTIPMPRYIGTEGERHIRIVTEANTADIVTAYPVFP